MNHIIKCESIGSGRLLLRPYDDAPTIKLGDTFDFVSDGMEIKVYAVVNEDLNPYKPCSGCWAYYHTTASWECAKVCDFKNVHLKRGAHIMEEL